MSSDSLFLAAIQNPQSDIGPAAGSPLWQLVFVSFAVVLILFEILRGWRRGLPRQVARLGAFIAAYFAGSYGGAFLGPLFRGFIKLPDAVLSIVAAALLAVIVYTVISGIGTLLFKRTRQHESSFIRLLYGIGGAVLGIFFGGLLVWMLVVAIRSLGAIGNAQVHQAPAASAANGPARPLHAIDVRRRVLGETDDSAPFMTLLARLKNSVELGTLGNAVKKADIIPTRTYDTLGKVGKVLSDPEGAKRFLSFPGARELSEHPKIVALRDDPQIAELLTQGRFFDLLQNEKIVDAANDPELAAQIRKFDLQSALDYAEQPQ